jgi:outer membrane murein-binding lipoprotein Lpp
MRTAIKYLAVLGLVLLGGCGGKPNEPLWDQISTLNEERNNLSSQVEQLQTENRQLKEENKTLLAIKAKHHQDAMDRLDRIAIRKRSGLYDKDKDGRPETLIVYLETVDKAQDRIKAPGEVEAELWDLGRPAEQALLGRWTVTPAALKTLWSATTMTNYYRLSFEAGDWLSGGEKELTVRVKFTDTLTGKILRDQYAFKL